MSEDRFRKILTLAVNPAAQDGEAQAAFGKLRELVRQNPKLTSLPPLPVMPPPVTAKEEEITNKWRITKIYPFWLQIATDNLSGQSYDLGLRTKFAYDFSETPTAIEITCTGSKEACENFGRSIEYIIGYINTQPNNP